jgi:hypothetical protein
MNLAELFHKTPKGEEEILHRSHGLVPRARSLLIMVNGKLTGDELQRRGESLGGGSDLFLLLVEGGYVEAAAVSTSLSAATPAPLAFSPAYAETARFASHFIVESLGPAYDELGGRIEACRDPAKFLHLLEGVRDVVDSNAGKKKAEAFWSGVKSRLPVD